MRYKKEKAVYCTLSTHLSTSLTVASDANPKNNFNQSNNPDGSSNRSENEPAAQAGGPAQAETRKTAQADEAFRPLFLTLALFSWLFAMLTSFVFDSTRTSQPLSGLSGLIQTLSTHILMGAWPWPQVLCGAVIFLAALLRCRHSPRPMAARLVICALAWLPLVFFMLAQPFMGPVSSTMIFGLSCLLVALPMDAAFRAASK